MFDETTSEQPDDPDFNESERERSRLKNPRKKRWIVVAALCFAIVIVGVAFVIMRPGSSDNSNSLGKTRSAQNIGAEVILYIKGRDTIMLAADEKTLDDLIAVISGRNDELQDLIRSGRVVTVPNGTRVRVVERGFGKTKVRVIEGDKILSEGWVPELWVW